MKFIREGAPDFIIPDASKEPAFPWMMCFKHMICGTNGVQGGTTWDDYFLIVSPNLTEKGLMLLLSEAGMAVLEFILIEQVVRVNLQLDAQKGVLNGNKQEVSGLHLYFLISCKY